MAAATPVYIVTSEWVRIAKEALAQHPRGAQARLAQEVGCDPSAITRLLRGEMKTSELVGPVSTWLKISPPHVQLPNDKMQGIVDDVLTLADDDLDVVAALTRHLRATREKHREEAKGRETARDSSVTESEPRQSGTGDAVDDE